MTGVIHDVRQAVQDIVAPGVQELKGEIKGLSAQVAAQNVKIDAVRSELKAEIGAVRSELGSVHSELKADIGSVRSELDSLRSDVGSLRSEMRAGNATLMSALETAILRGENSTLRDLSNLRERVTRLVDQISRKN